MTNLKSVIVIPAGGGKTSLASKGTDLLDIDALYHLTETQSTYDRINQQLQHRAKNRDPIPNFVGTELKERISSYSGPCTCLLAHTVAIAEQTGLELLCVYLPEEELHEKAIAARADSGQWFARTNRSVVYRECNKRGNNRTESYAVWAELADSVKTKSRRAPAMSKLELNILDQNHDGKQNFDDEYFLVEVLCSALGIPFGTAVDVIAEQSEPFTSSAT